MGRDKNRRGNESGWMKTRSCAVDRHHLFVSNLRLEPVPSDMTDGPILNRPTLAALLIIDLNLYINLGLDGNERECLGQTHRRQVYGWSEHDPEEVSDFLNVSF